MKTFLKAQAASFAATVVDFFVTVFCVEVIAIPLVLANATGNITGAIVNFMMGRKWVFDPSGSRIAMQAVKYVAVWSGYLLLNAGGIVLLDFFTSLHYIVSKIIVGVVLAVSYNYFLQKKFVFN